MSFRIVIPSRYGSTRLQGKPLLNLCGKTMIQRVFERASLSDASEIYIATDHQGIAAEAKRFGASVIMTKLEHNSGTDRLTEVANKLALADDEIVVNVQGDEPLIPPEVINQVAKNCQTHAACGCATLAEPIVNMDDFLNPNVVKVTLATNGQALYFSRAPIPYPRDLMPIRSADPQGQCTAGFIPMRHIGLYAYQAGMLRQFSQWSPSQLELHESLEQLRMLENGSNIHVEQAVIDVPAGIDTVADLERVRAILLKEKQVNEH